MSVQGISPTEISSQAKVEAMKKFVDGLRSLKESTTLKAPAVGMSTGTTGFVPPTPDVQEDRAVGSILSVSI